MTLKDIWQQAKLDGHSAVLDHGRIEARLLYGIKIKHDTDTGEVRIFNTSTGGDAYREFNEEEYNIFYREGWRTGCYLVALIHYKDRLEKAIEMRERSMAKGVSKKRMHNVLSSIDSLTESINQIKSKLYGKHI